jgi:four helix bundle protein
MLVLVHTYTNVNYTFSKMSYKNLKIWMKAREISIDVHKMSLTLPKYELYETGSQIRRSSKSIRSNIVEGYGRRVYQNDYLRFLIYSHSSIDETKDHLDTLIETGSLTDETSYHAIHEKLDHVGRMMHNFIQGVQLRN